MKPNKNSTRFGSITIDGEEYGHDVLIRLSGKVKKRKKKLSKRVYGSSHTLSLEEAEHIYEDGAELFIFGTGQNDVSRISEGALQFFKEKGCRVKSQPTPKAIEVYNKALGNVIGVFHVTC